MARIRILALLGVAGVVGLGGLRYFDMHPITVGSPPDEAEIGGSAPVPSTGGDVAVWIGPADPLVPDGYRYADYSSGWINLIEAEMGPCSVVTGERPDLTGYAALVVTSSALAAADAADLVSFLDSGGLLLFDAPNDGSAYPTHLASLLGGVGTAGRPFPDDDLLPAGLVAPVDREAFDEVPFHRPDAVLDLSDIGEPAADSTLFARADGSGQVVVSALNVGRFYTNMLQGAPHDDAFGLTQRFGDYDDILEPDDLVADVRLRQNEVPFADLFARAVCSLLDRPHRLPNPRLLWFPAGSDGLILMTHDEDFRGGEKSLWLTEWDRDLGLRGTTFAISTRRVEENWLIDGRTPSDMAQAIEEIGGSVGLHWNQYPMEVGIGPIEPIKVYMSLEEQIERFRAVSPATADVRTNRNHYLIVRDGWVEVFRVMAAHGIRLDSTFGANKGRGYLFGTARPYSILDDDGLPLAIRELPFVNQENWGGADQAYFSRLLAANAERHKGAIVSLFHPHLIILEDDGRALFEHVAKTALATNHRPFHFDEMLAFWEARIGATVQTGETRDGRVDVLVEVDHEDLAVAWPVTGSAAPRSAQTAGGEDLPVEDIEIGGVTYKSLRVPPGSHRISITIDG